MSLYDRLVVDGNDVALLIVSKFGTQGWPDSTGIFVISDSELISKTEKWWLEEWRCSCWVEDEMSSWLYSGKTLFFSCSSLCIHGTNDIVFVVVDATAHSDCTAVVQDGKNVWLESSSTTMWLDGRICSPESSSTNRSNSPRSSSTGRWEYFGWKWRAANIVRRKRLRKDSRLGIGRIGNVPSMQGACQLRPNRSGSPRKACSATDREACSGMIWSFHRPREIVYSARMVAVVWIVKSVFISNTRIADDENI